MNSKFKQALTMLNAIFNWEQSLALAIGFMTFFVVAFLAIANTDSSPSTGIDSLRSVVTWSKYIFWSTALILTIVCSKYCKKDSKGYYVYSDKHPWTKPFLRLATLVLSTSFGLLLGSNIHTY